MGAKEVLCALSEARGRLCLGKGVGAKRGARGVLKCDGAELNLLNHKVDAVEEVSHPLIVKW